MCYFGHVPKPVSWLGMEKVQLGCNCIHRKGSVGAEKGVQTFWWQNIVLDNKHLGNSSVRISHPNSLLPKRLAILRGTSPNSNSSNHCKVNSKLLLPCKRGLSGWKNRKMHFQTGLCPGPRWGAYSTPRTLMFVVAAFQQGMGIEKDGANGTGETCI